VTPPIQCPWRLCAALAATLVVLGRGALWSAAPCRLALVAAPVADAATINRASSPAPLVAITAVDPSIVIDLRYATPRNSFGCQLYPVARALLRRPVAQRLAKAQKRLQRQGLGLKIWDAYRPAAVQRRMWALKPGSRYIANPHRGSKHSRGAAVDVTLVDDKGRELPMPTPFDEFSGRAHPRYRGGTPVTRHNRELLRRAMEAAGFRQNPGEWWHYDDPQWRRYPLLDIPLSDL
jgi:zinc D-Ala-D-Ala dipeptidase